MESEVGVILFEDRRSGQEARNVGNLWKLEKAGKYNTVFSRDSEGTQPC